MFENPDGKASKCIACITIYDHLFHEAIKNINFINTRL